MTQAAHDGDNYLNRLYQALARSRATTQELEELIAEVEGLSREALHQRRRRTFKIVAIPALIGAGVEGAGVLFGNARRVAASTVVIATAASGITFAVINTPHHPHQYGALPGRPSAAPPGARPKPKIRPPHRQSLAPAAPDGPAKARPIRRPRNAGALEVARLPIVPDPPAVDTSPIGLPAQTGVPRTPVTGKRCLVDVRPTLPVAALCWRSR